MDKLSEINKAVKSQTRPIWIKKTQNLMKKYPLTFSSEKGKPIKITRKIRNFSMSSQFQILSINLTIKYCNYV